MSEGDFDWPLIGRNVRQARCLRGLSQEECAHVAGLGISTLYHLERGIPVHRRSLQKICEAFEMSLDMLRTQRVNVLAADVPLIVCQRSEYLWSTGGEGRAKVPEDNMERIQEERERSRLGHLGLVSLFVGTLNFAMPGGPGVILIELFGRFDEPINDLLFQDALLCCVAGSVRVTIADRTVVLEEGDFVGYHSKDLQSLEPIEETPLPVRLTWSGGVRLGTFPTGEEKRVKRKVA